MTWGDTRAGGRAAGGPKVSKAPDYGAGLFGDGYIADDAYGFNEVYDDFEFSFDEEYNLDDAIAAAPPQPVKARNAAGHGKGRGSRGYHPYLYASMIALSLLALTCIAVFMMPQLAGYFWKDIGNYAFVNGNVLRYDARTAAEYKQYREYMQSDVIYPGIFIDGVHVGGLSIEDARHLLLTGENGGVSAFSVAINVGNKTWTADNQSIPATRNLGNVLERAYCIARTNTAGGGAATPFEERLERALELRENGVNLLTELSYDHDAVKALVNEIKVYVTRAPQDAMIKSFDFKSRTFDFTDEQTGVTIDDAALYDELIKRLDGWEHGTSVNVQPVALPPNVTKAQMAASFKKVAAYTTDTTSDSNRNNNIDLACRAINGVTLMPGETFSFNDTTGQRTINKGYKEAGAIAGGQSIEEVGGGICQVSSTLFNAVVRADLQIVSRSPHAWPSTYVNRGEDATVNWPNLDFKFKNNKSTPVFIVAYYNKKKCSAEVYGMSLGDGVTIDLKSEVTRTLNPPNEVKYVQNTNLAFGESKETVKARTGYVVDTYKLWLKNGAETKRELLHTSTYKAYQRTVEYN